jgi:hypothetical protein
MTKILFLNNNIILCGVHEYGYNIAQTISKSTSYDFIYKEVTSKDELFNLLKLDDFKAIIYNYHPSTLPWVANDLELELPNLIHIGLVHEPEYGAPFKYKISQDPSFEECPPYFKQYSRNIFDYTNTIPLPEIPTIGSFGFAWADKGFEHMVTQVKKEFDIAKIRLHLPRSHFGDPLGKMGDSMIKTCNDLLRGSNIQLEFSREWKSLNELIDWLAQNSINAFFYDYKENRGISGPPDFAIAARRPIILTKSYMFKHLWEANPSIFIEDVTIKQAISNGLTSLLPFYEKWSEKKLVEDYDRIVSLTLKDMYNE